MMTSFWSLASQMMTCFWKPLKSGLISDVPRCLVDMDRFESKDEEVRT